MTIYLQLAALGVRPGRAAEVLPKALAPAQRTKIAADLGELRRQIENFLKRFGGRRGDRSHTSLAPARQEIANTVALLRARSIGRV